MMKKRQIHLPENTIIKEKYKIRNIIGSGGIGTTYKTENTESGEIVVIKALNLEQLESVKEIELFEREIETLKKIKHHAIPEYYDHFTYKYNENSIYILVQEFIDGENLYELVKSGHSFSEIEITGILKDLLTVLSYIHSLKPPVIHRDINPKNIILDKAEMLYLVDFGAVGRGRKDTLVGAKSDTFVGTLGYMPPEQLYGKVHPGLDIYAVGVTVLYLLTGKNPWEFPLDDMRIKYNKYVDISHDLTYLINKMIEPNEHRRFSSARKALDLVKEMEEFIKDDQRIRELENQKIIHKEKKITVKKDEKDWLKKAITKEQQEKEREKIRKAEEKRKEKIRELKEKKQQRKAENKDKMESDKFPSRTEIREHHDSLELIIKPYPFWRLFRKIFGLFRNWEFTNAFILTYAAPIVVWIGIAGALWELIDVFEPAFNVMVLLRIGAVFFVIGFVWFGFFLVYTIFTRSKYFETLNIRVSDDGMCAFYHVKPDKPYYVGPVSGISLKIVIPGNTLPAGKGIESKNWADIEIKVPKKDYEFYHTGFSTKDISVLQSFLRKTGQWRKKTGKKHRK